MPGVGGVAVRAAGLAAALALVLSGCTALRLAVAAGPMDCRTAQGVPIACPGSGPRGF